MADALPDGVGGVEEVAGGAGEDEAVGEEGGQAEAEGGDQPQPRADVLSEGGGEGSQERVEIHF